MTSLSEVRAGFLNPPKEYGLLPLWDLNNDLPADDIRWGLAEQARQGIAGVFLHPRSGMEVEYFSDAYWQAIEQSVAEGKRLGLATWLYDEYNWPSGVAGGRLLREHPEYRQVYLDYRRGRCAPGETCELSAPAGATLLSARAWREGDAETIDLLDAVRDQTVRWTAPELQAAPVERAARPDAPDRPSRASDWHVVLVFSALFPGRLWATGSAPWARGEAGALDYLNPDAVREFIRLTHEEYRARFGDQFGGQIPGIFTDEPATYYGWQWTPRFREQFQARMGYDLTPRLHELVVQAGNYVKTRCDFHRVALDLYADAFFRQLGRWAKDNRLIFTGHLLYEDKLDFLPAGQGGFYSTLRHLRMPGVDYLGDRTGFEPSSILVASNVGPKSLSSLAHATGKARSMVELYGGNGWGTPLARYKNVLNWVEVCGVNCIDPHAAYLSLKGHRKRDFPASHFVQEPWWRYYHHFAEYVARLSYLNAQGRHAADIALLYPQSTFWAEHVLWDKSPVWNEVAGAFADISTALLRLQRDYDYLFEETLLEGDAQIEGDRLRVAAESFSIVVLPPLTTIPLRVMEQLRDFAQGGGTLIVLGRLPRHTSEQRDDARLAQILDTLRADGRLTYVPTNGALDEHGWTSTLQPVLDELAAADVRVECEFARDVICQHRRLDDADIYLIANLSGAEGDAHVTLRAQAGGPGAEFELWDLERAVTLPLTTSVTADGRAGLSFHWLPYELLAVVALGAARLPPAEPTAAQRAERTPGSPAAALALKDWRLEPESPNCYVLEPWRVRSGEEERSLPTSRYDSLEALARANRKIAEARGIDPSELTVFMQVARDPGGQSQSNLWPPEGAAYERSATFRVEYLPPDLALVYEDLGEPVQVEINGTIYDGPAEPCFVWDRANRQIALAGRLHAGENTIALRTRMPTYRTQPPGTHGMEPVVLRGSFAVREGLLTRPDLNLPQPLVWNEAGWPNYSGAMTYHAVFNLSEAPAGRLLLVCDEVHETMDVTLNGAHAGLRLWPPYRLDVTAHVRAGENRLALTVTNTLSNLLTRPLPSGLGPGVRIVQMAG